MIAAGGTAGHVVPALAVADALRAEGAEVSFIGGDRAEAHARAGGRLPRCTRSRSRPEPHEPAARAARAAARGARAAAASALLRAPAPDAVMGGGGYVAGPGRARGARAAHPARADRGRQPPGADQPPARAARSARLPRVPDRAARESRVRGALPRHRAAGADDGARDREAARARLGIAAEETCVLVFGGSLGARSINLAALDGVRRAVRFACCTCSGRRDYAELLARELPPRLRPARVPGPRATSPTALAAATSSSRAPAARCSRSPRTGVPAILVPYPHAAGDHQSANARWMVDAGAAVVIADERAQRAAARARGRDAARRSRAAGGDGGGLARPRAPGRGATSSPSELLRGGAPMSAAERAVGGRGGCTSSASAAPA